MSCGHTFSYHSVIPPTRCPVCGACLHPHFYPAPYPVPVPVPVQPYPYAPWRPVQPTIIWSNTNGADRQPSGYTSN